MKWRGYSIFGIQPSTTCKNARLSSHVACISDDTISPLKVEGLQKQVSRHILENLMESICFAYEIALDGSCNEFMLVFSIGSHGAPRGSRRLTNQSHARRFQALPLYVPKLPPLSHQERSCVLRVIETFPGIYNAFYSMNARLQ
eukprot:scaffold2697_cov346-Pavlova_lutheri.AAC.12